MSSTTIKESKSGLNINSLVNFPYTQRLSWAKKQSYNFRWAEEMCDYYDYYYGVHTNNQKRDKYKLNYDLYNGRGDKAMEQYATGNTNERLEALGIPTGYEHVQHHDIISQIAKAMVGEQRQRPLHAQAIDSSYYALNDRKRKRTELFQEHIHEQFILPIQQEVTMAYMQENNIQDPFTLPPEHQQQMQADIQERTQVMTPSEIQEYMRKDYKTPSEKQAQQLLNYLLKDKNVKWTTDEGFKHAMITGEEIYYVGVRHNEPVFELVNPLGFTYSAAPNTFFVEQGEWAKYEQTIKYSDLFNKYGDQFKASDYKKLDQLFHGLDNSNYSEIAKSNLVSVFSNLPDGTTENINMRTKEGQEWLKNFYKENGSLHQAQSDLREVHTVWKSLRKLKHVTRIEADRKITFWAGEDYVYNSMKGDVEQKEVWVPEVWECTKIGTIDALYFNKRPIPFQYKSVHNPWDVKLPYYGVQYGRLMGNAANVSPIDLGKPWQFKFNVQMARLQEMEATDLGKVLLTTMDAMPQDWELGDFFAMLKYGKMAPLELTKEGVSAYDAQFFKGVDMSNLDKMMGQTNYLQWLQSMVANAMSYNASRLGQISPYTAVTNNQQNIVQSSFQTEDVYSTHQKVVENVLNGLINAARVAYKHNPPKKSYILDDMSVAELDLDWEMLSRSELGIFISNASEDYANLQQIKQQAQAMIQNGMISFSELIKLHYATSGAEVINMAEAAQERVEQQRQQAAQQEQESVQMQMQMQMKMKEFEAKLASLAQDKELEYKYTAALLDSQKMANQYDIDQNNINDGLQREQMKIDAASEENEKDRELSREELAAKERIERFKLKNAITNTSSK